MILQLAPKRLAPPYPHRIRPGGSLTSRASRDTAAAPQPPPRAYVPLCLRASPCPSPLVPRSSCTPSLVPFHSPLPCSSALNLDESEKLGIDHVGVCRTHAVREPLVDLERALL